MYLRETWIYTDVPDVVSNIAGDNMTFRSQTCHINAHFDRLVARKIKTDDIWKIVIKFCRRQPVFGKYERLSYYSPTTFSYDKYSETLGVLGINTFFDFQLYYSFKDNVDKSNMISDVFEEEIIKAFVKFGFDGISTAKRAFQEIREKNYLFEGTHKQTLFSPNKSYKLSFPFVWKLDGIDLSVRVRKPRGKKDLCLSFLTTIESEYGAIANYIGSIDWLSEHEFVAKMSDISGRKQYFNIAECNVRDYVE